MRSDSNVKHTQNYLHTRLRSGFVPTTAFVETVTFLEGYFPLMFKRKNLRSLRKYFAYPLKQSEEFQDHCPK